MWPSRLCSLVEQLDSIKESLDEKGLSALTLFLQQKKVCSSLRFSSRKPYLLTVIHVCDLILHFSIQLVVLLGYWFHNFLTLAPPGQLDCGPVICACISVY